VEPSTGSVVFEPKHLETGLETQVEGIGKLRNRIVSATRAD
jgi:hypothetical protein